MMEKHILTFIALLFAVFLVLLYILSSGSNSISVPGKTYLPDADNTAASIPVDTAARIPVISHSVVSENPPTNETPSMTPDAGFSNAIPDSELKEKAESGWELAWNDEFNGSVIDDKYWTLQTGEDIWGNNELQYYTDRTDNCCVEDGKLIIRGLREKYGNSGYTSARIVTKDKLSFLYGRIEVKAKLPKGRGLLSGIWFLPCEHIYDYRAKNGEFDLVEMLGNNPKVIYGVAHYSFNGRKKSYKKYVGKIDYSKDFHIYSIEWGPRKVKWLVDDKVYFTFDVNDAFDNNYNPFNKRFYLIINLAIGGDWPGDDLSHTAFPSLLEVDYVRYFLPKKP